MPNKKVLIVDDDKEFLEELSESLRSSGYEIIAVNNPSLVLDIANAKKPNVILLDLKMPGKSGFLLADELRTFSGLADVPLIAMSGYFKKGDSVFLDIHGFKNHIEKPFGPSDIIAKIEEVLLEKK